MFISLAFFRPGLPFLLTVHLPSFSVHLSTARIHAILALIAGVLVLVRPKNLNLIIASYLLVLGVVMFFRLSF